jgi:hypothetical protein
MKNLANCKPSEFLRQANKIRKAVGKWLTDTQIMEIRKRLPAYETAPANATAEERKAVIERNKQAESAQARENLTAILDSILEDFPDETLEIIGLCCFIEPEEIDNHTTGELIKAVTDLINDEAVLSFFTSLMKLVNRSSTNASKA